MGDPIKHPFDMELMPPVEPPSLNEVVLDERHLAYARLRWPDAAPKSQIYWCKQVIWAHFQKDKPHPDDPTGQRKKFGGRQPGGGAHVNKRAGIALVEAAQGRQKELIDAAFAPIGPRNDPMDRHRAAMNIYKQEREERAMEIVEDEYARKTNEEVTREAAALFAEMFRNGEISLSDIVDATAVDLDDESDDGPQPQQISA
ncbi:MAG: hypothetical protein H0U53_01870 [Actinobacteria bacterium]|nr:hypothetical protein [Actinomycetota bacterium]